MPDAMEDSIPFQARLRIGGETVGIEGRARTGPMRMADFLPVLQLLDDAVTGVATRAVENTGRRISCRAGCGACCRQMVPIGEAEAVRLIELIEQLPPDRRERIRERFQHAVARLHEMGLYEHVRSIPQLHDGPELQRIGTDYFHAAIPCPFLEDESCSIHPDRPLRCREYLVTSPAANCSDPGPGRIEMVPLSRHVSRLLFSFGDGGKPRWIPMILMLEWAAQHSGDAQPAHDGRALFETFLKRMSQSENQLSDTDNR